MTTTRKAIAGLIVVVAGGLMASCWSLDERFRSFPERTVASETGIRSLSVEQKLHDDHMWYLKATLRPDDGKALLARFPFKKGFTLAVSEGMYLDSRFQDCLSCWYYREKEPGQYSWRLYVLQADLVRLQAFETWE